MLASPLTDKEYAQCFNAFKSISTEWKAIQDWLKHDFIPSLRSRDSVNILSVGSGTGDFDLTLMKMVQQVVPEISYVGMDPNQEHNAIFHKRFNKSQLNIKSFEIVPKPFGDDDSIHQHFDIIHLTHCLYYIPDRKRAIQEAYRLLKPGGSLLIFHQTPLGINEIQRRFMMIVKQEDREMFSSREILNILKEYGFPFTFDMLVSDLDVTDCILNKPEGDLLLNFFLECNFADMDDTIKKDIISSLQEECQARDGRYLLFHPSGIFWIKKGFEKDIGLKIRESRQGSIPILSILGRLDSSTSFELEERTMSLFKNRNKNLILDLTGLDYMSSSGLRVILLSGKKSRSLGGEMVLVGPRDRVKEIIEIVGFDQIFSIFPSLDEALHSFES